MTSPRARPPDERPLAVGNALLLCERDHEHICGIGQLERILADICPWCHTRLRVVSVRPLAPTVPPISRRN